MEAQEKFVLLEEKVGKVLEAAKRLKDDNTRLSKENQSLESKVKENDEVVSKLQEENELLTMEREEVRERIDALITRLESFDFSAAGDENQLGLSDDSDRLI